MKNHYGEGGLQVPDPSAQADSLKIMWIKKFLDENNHAKWKFVVQNKLLIGGNLSIFECKLSKREVECKFPDKFWREIYLAWQTMVEEEDKTDGLVLYESLWHNRYLNLDDMVGIPKKKLQNSGVLRINDIYDRNAGRLMPPDQLTEKYGIGNFLLWHRILKVIPKEWRQILREKRPRVREVRPEIYVTLQETIKVAKWAYSVLMKSNKLSCPRKAQTKWEQELQGVQSSWPSVFKILYKSTQDFKLKWLQLRILHRILPTNRVLNWMKIKESSMCDRCFEPNEDIYHVFWGCKDAKRFWMRLKHTLVLPKHFTPEDIFLGNVTGKGKWTAAPLRVCVLLGKQFIWQCRWSGEEQSVQRFSLYLAKYISVEKCIVARRGGRKRFDETFGLLWEALCTSST
ncbi:uncharacterized protein LOC122365356 [Amphibalanus amphitrite]|uniref:uncharacterized protein LOC122365356 n=1 Tax=Amphibalanus amphitrite TaxID=1232801 RepID=UPI001C9051E1|nr:uncharacterized protein LOC122365356 [Amphibalanus amphitrite]